MRVLLRVAAALLLAIPVFLALVVFFALSARRTSLSAGSGDSRSLERGASTGAYRFPSDLSTDVSP